MMDVSIPWGSYAHVTVKTDGGVFLSLDDVRYLTMRKAGPKEARQLAALLLQAADEEEKQCQNKQ